MIDHYLYIPTTRLYKEKRKRKMSEYRVYPFKMINTKYLYLSKQDVLSIMLYKVNVNLCDFRAGTYVTLGTRAAQRYIYMSLR